MQLIYIDESGDPGDYVGTNTEYFCLSGLIIDQNHWVNAFRNYKSFRKHLNSSYGLHPRIELHASELFRIKKIQAYKKISKGNRARIFCDTMNNIDKIVPNATVINVCLDKKTLGIGIDFQTLAWKRMLERYDLYLKKEVKDLGIVIADTSNEKPIRGLMRKLRVYNQVSSHYGGTYSALTDNIIEDPVFRDSKNSAFIQLVDTLVTALRFKEYPKGSLKKFGVNKLLENNSDICLKKASKHDPHGIVRK